MIRSPQSQARYLLQQLALRKQHTTLEFLWHGCTIAVPGTFSVVYANQLTTETYRKIIVLTNGEICCGVNLPAMMWLGHKHVRGTLSLLDDIDLQMMYNTDSSQPQNEWWNSLRKQYKSLANNVLYGDIVFARQGEDLHWDKHAFMALVARGLAQAEAQ